MLMLFYRWRFPPDLEESFLRDWPELTKTAVKEFGASKAKLSKSENGSFVAVGYWPSLEQWQRWRVGLKTHPKRELYRGCRIEGPEILYPIVTITSEED